MQDVLESVMITEVVRGSWSPTTGVVLVMVTRNWTCSLQLWAVEVSTSRHCRLSTPLPLWNTRFAELVEGPDIPSSVKSAPSSV